MSLASFSRFVLRYKMLVAVFWLLTTIMGVACSSNATAALSQRFDLSGSEGTQANQAIGQTYASGGFDQPLVATIILPSGVTVDTTGARDRLSVAFSRVTVAVPQAHVVSYASTADQALP